MKATCVCGTEFTTFPSKQKVGRGRYCSKSCLYKYRTRPKGLNYNIKSDNPSWFIAGEFPGNENALWKKDRNLYERIHRWARKNKGYKGYCSNCYKSGKTHLANKSGEYKYELEDWMELCPKCHKRIDYRRLSCYVSGS